MTKAFGEYQRLARSALGFSSVWLGQDHLLYVKGSGFLLPYSEEYKRFRYREIQAVTMARGTSVWPGALGYLALLVLVGGFAFALLFNREPGDSLLVFTLVVPLPLAALLLGLLIRHLVLGPRCAFEIQTGLKRERLAAINRFHAGREAMNRLGVKIREAQKDVIPRVPSVGEDSLVPSDEFFPSPKPALPMRVPRMSGLAFALQLAAAASLIVLLHVSHPMISGLMILLALAGAIPLMIALASGVRRPAPDPVRLLLWWQCVTMAVLGATSAFYYIDQAINDPAVTIGLMGPLEAFASIPALGGFGFYLIYLVAGIGHFGIAFAGIWQTRKWTDQLKSVSPSPVSDS